MSRYFLSLSLHRYFINLIRASFKATNTLIFPLVCESPDGCYQSHYRLSGANSRRWHNCESAHHYATLIGDTVIDYVELFSRGVKTCAFYLQKYIFPLCVGSTIFALEVCDEKNIPSLLRVEHTVVMFRDYLRYSWLTSLRFQKDISLPTRG